MNGSFRQAGAVSVAWHMVGQASEEAGVSTLHHESGTSNRYFLFAGLML